jgi:mannose-6-phosphate isomerase-like protein (cupin superfamily)
MGQAIRLASNFVVLDDTFKADVVEVTPGLYERLEEDYKDFAGHLLVSSHAFDEDWPTWEIHPAGDEFVILVSGDADLALATPDGDETIRMTEPGTFVIVPRDTWHTARIRRHTVMMFITPGEGTVNREEPVRGA